MKTIIEFKDGHAETVEDAAPTVYFDSENSVSFIDTDCGVVGDDVPLEMVKRIIFEND